MNTALPAATDVLDRLAAVLPAELVDPTTLLINFVTRFVSPEIANSQNIANWPGNVQAGLNALNTYTAEECPLIGR
jgi:hypothetical protein